VEGLRHRVAALALAVVGTCLVGTPALSATTVGTASNFSLVGHEPLGNRGVNAAGAIYDHYEYIGSRSDGTHLHPGVEVVDIGNPAHPRVVNEIAPTAVSPEAATATTSRELRVWPEQKLLIVIYFGCSSILHACVGGSDVAGSVYQGTAFFDLADGAHPRLVNVYQPSSTPHEMFLWVDPKNPSGRALMFFTSPNDSAHSLVVTDISKWRTGQFPEIGYYSIVSGFSSADQGKYDVRLHSISLSADGTRMYLAHLGGGFLVVDSSDFANKVTSPHFRLLTPIANRVSWDNQGAHSSVPIPTKPYAFTTEEIYGKGVVLNDAFGPALGGCPWGWVRVINSADPAHPAKVAEFQVDENRASFCAGLDPNGTQENFSSYASHNPTVLPDLALLTWHSAGLRAVDLADPTHPGQAGFFVPTPDAIQPGHTVDPALEPGSNGQIAWSYPVIRNGLIYYVDIINGLYIVKYNGPHASEVNCTAFYEGNSNVGDAPAIFAGKPGRLCPAAGTPVAPVVAVEAGMPITAALNPRLAAPAALLILLVLALGTGLARALRRGGQ
jgi:hypothetical protein